MTFRARHLLGIEHLAPDEITTLLDLADKYADLNRKGQHAKDAAAVPDTVVGSETLTETGWCSSRRRRRSRWWRMTTTSR